MNHVDILTTAGIMGGLMYWWRISQMHSSTHRWRSIALQLAGALASLAIASAALYGLSAGLLYPPAIALCGHLLVSSARWHTGPPVDTESRPMGLDMIGDRNASSH